MEELVGFLFEGGEGGPAGTRGGRRSGKSSDRTGGKGGPQLTVPDWVDAVNELFPHSVKEVMQKELVNRGIAEELMEKPELLEKIEPNLELVKTLLTHSELMNPKTRASPQVEDHREGGGGTEAENAGAGGGGDHRGDPQGPPLAAEGVPQPRP